jgi:hypothetical protein
MNMNDDPDYEFKYLECPCCGHPEAAVADENLLFWDGQDIVCGCAGNVSCDTETSPYIMTYCDEQTETCPENQPAAGGVNT